jgi:hypothetical protein
MRKRRAGRLRTGLAVLFVAALCFAGLAVFLSREHRGAAATGGVGLFTSLPILWPETEGVAGLLDADAPPHWALAVLAAQGRVVPLDTLAGKDGKLPLPAGAILVMAQPRPLSPAENVALDDWVRAGGRVLLFADPMLTGHSAFALGDRRRPQDVVMLSPILTRWGLELRFDESQPAGEREVALLGTRLPVNLPGHLAVLPNGRCVTEADGLAAHCRVGAGEVLCIADAALLEMGTNGDDAPRREALSAILRRFSS